LGIKPQRSESCSRHRKQETFMTDRSSRRSVAQRVCAIFVAAVTTTMIAAGPAKAAGDAVRGEKLYQDCHNCHSIEKNGLGPLHKGVVGRVAGTVPNYEYSDALKKAGIVWTENNLDKWLTDPQGLVPGTKMFYDVQDAQDRADIIAFLKDKAR
jgi:cytochrome c